MHRRPRRAAQPGTELVAPEQERTSAQRLDLCHRLFRSIWIEHVSRAAPSLCSEPGFPAGRSHAPTQGRQFECHTDGPFERKSVVLRLPAYGTQGIFALANTAQPERWKMVTVTAATAQGPGRDLRGDLRHVYWLGGASGSGKSTVARQLAATYGFHLYDTDEVMADHGSRTRSDDCPLMTAFAAMDADERWVTRSPELMLETFPWFRGEGFELIVDDLLHLPTSRPVVAEGFRLLPQLVQPLLADPRHAVWLVPTPELRMIAFECRRPSGPPWSFVDRTTDPDRALRNLLTRDQLFSEDLKLETKTCQLHMITVDASMRECDVVEEVVAWFGL